MIITRTIAIEGHGQAEHAEIKAYLEAEAAKVPGWSLFDEPEFYRVTATKTEETSTL